LRGQLVDDSIVALVGFLLTFAGIGLGTNFRDMSKQACARSL
jgi:hypothetical protein